MTTESDIKSFTERKQVQDAAERGKAFEQADENLWLIRLFLQQIPVSSEGTTIREYQGQPGILVYQEGAFGSAKAATWVRRLLGGTGKEFKEEHIEIDCFGMGDKSVVRFSGAMICSCEFEDYLARCIASNTLVPNAAVRHADTPEHKSFRLLDLNARIVKTHVGQIGYFNQQIQSYVDNSPVRQLAIEIPLPRRRGEVVCGKQLNGEEIVAYLKDVLEKAGKSFTEEIVDGTEKRCRLYSPFFGTPEFGTLMATKIIDAASKRKIASNNEDFLGGFTKRAKWHPGSSALSECKF